jgi:hypothetical protein
MRHAWGHAGLFRKRLQGKRRSRINERFQYLDALFDGLDALALFGHGGKRRLLLGKEFANEER